MSRTTEKDRAGEDGAKKQDPSPPAVRLWHRTSEEAARSILEGGFKDHTGTYLTDVELSGVWLSDVPLDGNEGCKGRVLLRVDMDVPESAIAEFECIEEERPYTEWLIPADFLAKHATVTRADDDDEAPRTRLPRPQG
jgi:hypothetical protein